MPGMLCGGTCPIQGLDSPPKDTSPLSHRGLALKQRLKRLGHVPEDRGIQLSLAQIFQYPWDWLLWTIMFFYCDSDVGGGKTSLQGGGEGSCC